MTAVTSSIARKLSHYDFGGTLVRAGVILTAVPGSMSEEELDRVSKLAKRLALGVTGIVIVIQLYRPSRTNPPIDPGREISATLKVDSAVQSIVDRSCKDCHSNGTVWPWYSEVAPVSWLVANDVSGGRRHVNFSEWGTYPGYKHKDLLDKVCKEVTDRDMPPWTYLLIHRDAQLSDSDREAVCGWTKAAAGQIAASAAAFQLPASHD